MHVFITGATGFIGRAVTRELIQHGHSVLGLSRNDGNAEIIRSLGAEPHKGDLEDLDSLRRGAKAADAVIHLGFIHDFTRFEHVCSVDHQAIQAMGEELSGKPLLIASGTMSYPAGKLAIEDSEVEREGPLSVRNLSSDLVISLSKDKGVLGSIIRIAPTVHGKDDNGFMVTIGGLAKQIGGSYYVGDGQNQWPAVHRLDLAVLIRLALEKRAAGGVTYHAVAELVHVKDFMTVIGKKLQLPVLSKSLEEVSQAMGFFGMLIGRHSPISSEKTQKALSWTPTQIGLLTDLEQNYFQ